MQPSQQQGRRIPSFNSETTRLTWSSLVFCCLTKVTQQIHSLRARGVRSFHSARALSSEAGAFCRSSGILCTVPSEIAFLVMRLFYQIYEQNYRRFLIAKTKKNVDNQYAIIWLLD